LFKEKKHKIVTPNITLQNLKYMIIPSHVCQSIDKTNYSTAFNSIN